MAVDIKHYIGAFLDEYQGSFSGLWHQNVAQVFTGLQSLTTIMPGMEAPRDLAAWGGSRSARTPTDFEVTLTSTAYESSVKFPLDNYKLDSIGVYENNVRELARKARFHFNKLTAGLITTNGLCSDGQNFFDTDHTYNNGSALTQSNVVTATEIPSLNVATVTDPTDVEMAQILVDSFAYMVSLKDAAGDAANGDMRSLSVVTGDVKKFAAIVKAIGENRLSNATDNPVTGLRGYGVSFTPVFEPSLTGASIYFLREDSIVKPFILGEVLAEPVILGPETEYAKQNRAVLFAYDAVRGATYGRYQSAIKATLS